MFDFHDKRMKDMQDFYFYYLSLNLNFTDLFLKNTVMNTQFCGGKKKKKKKLGQKDQIFF